MSTPGCIPAQLKFLSIVADAELRSKWLLALLWMFATGAIP
jgi:hypothetical protein